VLYEDQHSARSNQRSKRVNPPHSAMLVPSGRLPEEHPTCMSTAISALISLVPNKVGGRRLETRSYHNSVGCRKCLVYDIACVARLCGLKYQNLGFSVGHRAMLDTTRDNTQLATPQSQTAVAEFDSHLATPNQEHLVLVLVMMPGKVSSKLHKLDLLPIQPGDDLRSPMLMNHGKLVGQGRLVQLLCAVCAH
jgi:hypothetical protein